MNLTYYLMRSSYNIYCVTICFYDIIILFLQCKQIIVRNKQAHYFYYITVYYNNHIFFMSATFEVIRLIPSVNQPHRQTEEYSSVDFNKSAADIRLHYEDHMLEILS